MLRRGTLPLFAPCTGGGSGGGGGGGAGVVSAITRGAGVAISVAEPPIARRSTSSFAFSARSARFRGETREARGDKGGETWGDVGRTG